jgi:2-amino-4-hydroxy-6-hydroxymethyldihydropteridine diphosphokinase
MSIRKTTAVYLGLGSNLGNREPNLRRAVKSLLQFSNSMRCSHLYDTAPVGNLEQPRFLNIVCEMTTALTPEQLLSVAKNLEREMGRFKGPPNGPRPIDIDILFYGDRVINNPYLVIPHPRLETRAFVLLPLTEIAPDVIHPVTGKTAKEMLGELKWSQNDISLWANDSVTFDGTRKQMPKDDI